MVWPIDWPADPLVTAASPETKALAEQYAANTLRLLTLGRVGGEPVTIRPQRRVLGYWQGFRNYAGVMVGNFFASTVYPSSRDLQDGFSMWRTDAIVLPPPVGDVTEVTVDGEVLLPGSYFVENDTYLVRTLGLHWGSAEVSVTYLNAHPVDTLGEHVGGVLAFEYLKMISGEKKCRLPSTVTSIARQGVTMELQTGMFPDGFTSIPEVDHYIVLWNPNGMKVKPRVYSPDLHQLRQTTWS